jgi:radical SAM superfamily enzyme YgiQ (UPF0313 family)
LEKILLLNPPGDKLYQRDMYCSNISKGKYYWPAIDLLILSGTLGQSYEVDVLDALIEKMSPDECLARILVQDYKAVIFLTGSASWPLDMEFVARIKAERPEICLIGNGDILLYKARDFLERYPYLDAVLLDYTSRDVLAFLQNDRSSLTAMAYRENGSIVVKHEPVQVGEFTYPVPQHEKFPLGKYLLVHGRRFPFTTVQASWGCPFKCTFCIAATLGYRYRAVDNVLEELRYVVSLGVKDVFFTDFTFEASRRNTLELCRRMVEEGLDLTWVCSSRASTLDEELINCMRKAGCHTLLLGVESGDEGLLKTYSKGTTKEALRQAFSLCRRYGIRTVGHFIIGLPGETEESARKTIDFAKELDCDIASFNVAVPAPGTILRETAIAEGYLKDEGLVFDATDAFPVMETPQFSREQAWEWRKRAVKEFYFRPSYLWKSATTTRSWYQWKLLVLNGLALVKQVFLKH